MPRLPGDPSILGWLLFSIGFRLPPKNREWGRHELIDAGWRGRTIRRLLVLMVPICIALAFLPGPVWLRVAVPLFALVASVGTGAVSARRPGPDQRRRHPPPPPPPARPAGPQRPRHRPPGPLTGHCGHHARSPAEAAETAGDVVSEADTVGDGAGASSRGPGEPTGQR